MDHLFDQRYYYTIVGSGISERGDVWTSQAFQNVAGRIDHANIEGLGGDVDIMFAGPANSLEEAKALYEKLYAGEN